MKGEVIGDEVKVVGDPGVFEQVAPLYPTDPGGVLEHEWYPFAGVLEVHAMIVTLEHEVHSGGGEVEAGSDEPPASASWSGPAACSRSCTRSSSIWACRVVLPQGLLLPREAEPKSLGGHYVVEVGRRRLLQQPGPNLVGGPDAEMPRSGGIIHRRPSGGRRPVGQPQAQRLLLRAKGQGSGPEPSEQPELAVELAPLREFRGKDAHRCLPARCSLGLLKRAIVHEIRRAWCRAVWFGTTVEDRARVAVAARRFRRFAPTFRALVGQRHWPGASPRGLSPWWSPVVPRSRGHRRWERPNLGAVTSRDTAAVPLLQGVLRARDGS